MKHVIVRCEDYARAGAQTASLLEGAKTAHLQQLSQAGAVGLIRPPARQRVVDRFQLHRGLLGMGPHDAEVAPSQCYAASANVTCGDGEVAWCCELMTQHESRIIDATAGNIPTKESRILMQALNAQLGSESRRWELGDGSHHVLVTRDPVLSSNSRLSVESPELLVGRSWKRSLPKGPASEALRLLIDQASRLLEGHAVNRVRVDLGENPANMVWLWGAAAPDTPKTFRERTGLSGAVVSTSFPMRGVAQLLGLRWEQGPSALKEEPLRRLMKLLATLLQQCDLVYVHARVEHADPVERLCEMERLDQLVLKPLTDALAQIKPWRLLVAIDDRAGVVPFVAIGSGLPQQPAARLHADRFAESPLRFEDGAQLFAWFTKA